MGSLLSRPSFFSKTSFPPGDRHGYHICLSLRDRGVFLRPLGDVLAADLPEKLEQVAFCELSAAQREIYTSLASATRRELSELAGKADQKKSRMVMLTALLRLRQAACDARLLPLDTPPAAEDASAKLELLSELLAEALDGGHRWLSERGRHLHWLHHARFPRQVHALHG